MRAGGGRFESEGGLRDAAWHGRAGRLGYTANV